MTTLQFWCNRLNWWWGFFPPYKSIFFSLGALLMHFIFEQWKCERALDVAERNATICRKCIWSPELEMQIVCMCIYDSVQTLNHECRHNSKCGNLCSTICTIACSFLGPMPLIMFQHVLVFCCFFSHFIHNIFVSALKEFYMKVEASCKRKYHQISRGNTFESIKEMHFSEMVHIQSVSFYVITEWIPSFWSK